MAEIKVDKTDRRDRDHESHGRRFPWWLLAIPILGLLLVPSLWNHDRDDRAALDNSRTASALTFQDRSWEPSGNSVRLDDDQLHAVGHAADGRVIYSTATAGGGGGRAVANGQYYLRLNNDLYQPIRRMGEE